MQYAIGGSMNPSVKSQANLFIAPKSGNKEVKFQYFHCHLSYKNAYTRTNIYTMHKININRWRGEMVKKGHGNFTQWMMYLKMELDSLKHVLVG